MFTELDAMMAIVLGNADDTDTHARTEAYETDELADPYADMMDYYAAQSD